MPALIETRGQTLRVNMHAGQSRAWDSDKRFVFVIAGTQGGKTSFGSYWLRREIDRCGPGDYLVVTATYDLFKLKLLPEMRTVFCETLRREGWRYEASDRVITNGVTRIILRSANAPGGLESATVKAAWLDECVAPETLIATEYGDLPISQIVRERMPVRVWSYDTRGGIWELRSVTRWIRLPQRNRFMRLGKLRLTANHKVWTREAGYVRVDAFHPALYSTCNTGGKANVTLLRAMWCRVNENRPEAFLQPQVRGDMARFAAGVQSGAGRTAEADIPGPGTTPGNIGASEATVCRPCKSTLATAGRGTDRAFARVSGAPLAADAPRQDLGAGRQWSAPELASRETGASSQLGERVCGGYWQRVVASRVQNRYSRTTDEDCYRGWQRSESAQTGMVQAEWVELPALLESDGGELDSGLSSDGCVYNLEVERNHNYIADGILVSNCGQDDFRLESWEAVLRRLSLAQGRVLGTTTPYNLGWLKTQVFDRWRAGEPDYDVIQFRSTMNPAFPAAEYERAKRTMPPWKHAMFYDGEFSRPAGLIYEDFDPAVHVVKPFPVSELWPVKVGIDFGSVHTALVWIAEQNGKFYLFRESLTGGLSTPEHAQRAKETARLHRSAQWYGGAPGEDQNRMDWSAAGVPVRKPFVADVEAGIDRVIALLRERRLFVFETCKGVIDEFGMYSRELDAAGLPTDKIKDKATFHRLDALRYAASALTQGVGRASSREY